MDSGGYNDDLRDLFYLSEFKYKFFAQFSSYRLVAHMLGKDKFRMRLQIDDRGIIYDIAGIVRWLFLERYNGRYRFITHKQVNKLDTMFLDHYRAYNESDSSVKQLLSLPLDDREKAFDFLNKLQKVVYGGCIMSSSEEEAVAYKKTLAYFLAGLYGYAFMIAFRYRYRLRYKEEFVALFIRILQKKRLYYMAAVEAIGGLCRTKKDFSSLLDIESQQEYETLIKMHKRKYVLCVTRDVGYSAMFLTEMVQLGDVLKRLGNEVIFCFRVEIMWIISLLAVPIWITNM